MHIVPAAIQVPAQPVLDCAVVWKQVIAEPAHSAFAMHVPPLGIVPVTSPEQPGAAVKSGTMGL
jgi:hypothetical protein